MDNDNMGLWNRQKVTDTAFTKRVSHRGGFTSIDQTYQSMQATKEFGPYGAGWGVKDAVFGYVGDPPTETWCEAQFFYLWGGDVHEYPVSVDMLYKPGQDTRKKLLTECKSKALAMLGFSADVYMGKFESQAYVEELEHDKGFESAVTEAGKRDWLLSTMRMCGCKTEADCDAIVRWAIVDDNGKPKWADCEAMKEGSGASEVFKAIGEKRKTGTPYKDMLPLAKDAANQPS